FRALTRELEEYAPKLARRPRIIAANKMDIAGAQANLEKLRRAQPEDEIFPISAVTGLGLDTLLHRLCELVETWPVQEPVNITRVIHQYREEEPFTI
ncbi:MAG: GTPase ObgE, partial [Syntrophomonadaceae bacterium]|nr:GTPase ObgE [Syntrophomonadaceae bacterium]